ncbi:BglG family transcription antiterminator [Enterococcus sp. LJL90]
MEFSNRELLLIDYLLSKESATSQEMANYLAVSKRTVKKDLARIKMLINVEHEYLVATPAKGYTLKKSYHFKRQGMFLSRDKDLILNNYDRVAYIIQKLLLLDSAIKYEELAGELFVSLSSLKQDMYKVRSLLFDYKLKLKHTPNQGVLLIGSEYNLRLAIANFFYHSFLSYLSPLNQKIYKRNTTILYLIESKINNLSLNHHIQVSDSSINDLAIEILITYQRVEYEDNLPQYVLDCDEADYLITKELINEIGFLFPDKNLSNKSIAYICRHLTSKKIIKDTELIDTRTETVIKEIIKEIYQNFDLDFSEDLDLWEKVKLHIVSLRKRIQYGFTVQNPQVFRFLRSYLFAAKITCSAINILENHMKTAIPNEEQGFFILYFQAMLERMASAKKILIYTGGNRAERTFLENYFNMHYNKKNFHYKFIDTLPSPEDKFDLLLSSTNKISNNYQQKIVVTNNTKDQLKNIPNYLKEFENNHLILEKYINHDSLLLVESKSKKKVINEIFDHLLYKGYLKDQVKCNFSFQEIGNGIVHIIDLHKIIKHNICLVVLLKRPILWKQTVIKTLFLIKTKKDGDKDLNILCNSFSSLVNNPNHIKKIHENPDILTLIEQLRM